MFAEAPGPIGGHNGVYFQKEGTLKRPITLVLPDSLSLFSFISALFIGFSFSLSLPPFYHFVSSNNASSQFTSHLSLSCARTPSSPSYYVVSVRFVDGVICMKTGGQKATGNFSHLSPRLIFRRTAEDGPGKATSPSASLRMTPKNTSASS